MENLNVETRHGTVLNGVLFPSGDFEAVIIAITGIHGNFYSNPFYYNIGDKLSANGIDFIYAQTNDAFGEIETFNKKTGEKELIGSWNERFSYTEEDILMSPANLTYMMSGVSEKERDFIEKPVRYGSGDKVLPFYFMGWVVCKANTAQDRLIGMLNNVHTEKDGNYTTILRTETLSCFLKT